MEGGGRGPGAGSNFVACYFQRILQEEVLDRVRESWYGEEPGF
jgi:hypothetical protein